MRSQLTTRRLTAAAGTIVVALIMSAGTAGAQGPTCSDVGLDIEVHGQHIVRDYVVGPERADADGSVGSIIGGDGGAHLPGGPGPASHFTDGVAPGASCCTDSNSFGLHL